MVAVTSSLPNRHHTPVRPSYVIRAVEDDSRPARMGSDLTQTEYAPVGVADPRLVDPYLAEIVEQAKEAARVEGYEAGRQAGFDVGRREGLELLARREEELVAADAAERASRRERLVALHQTVQGAVATALDYQAPTIAEMQGLIIGLAEEIAEALVGHHLMVGDCVARDAVQRVLEQVPRRVSVRLRLHPDDAAEIESIAGDFDHDIVEVIGDPAITRGDAVAEAENLEVESTLDDAIGRVRDALGLRR